mgnify:CR=1 FL=1
MGEEAADAPSDFLLLRTVHNSSGKSAGVGPLHCSPLPVTSTNPPPSAPDPQGSPGRSDRRRRFLWILLLACVAGVSTYSYWLPRLVESLLSPVAPYFGYRVQVQQVARCDLGGIEIHGLHLESKLSRGALRRLDVQHFSATFGWRALLGQLQDLRSIQAAGIRLELDTGLEPEPQTAKASAPTNWMAGFDSLPQVEVSDVVVQVKGEIETAQHELTRLAVEEGAIDLRARSAERNIAATAQWQSASLTNLRVEVDGDLLLQDTKIDLSKAYLGNIALQAALPIGAQAQVVEAQLNEQGIRWQAKWTELDLAALQARLPMDLGVELRGSLSLESLGQLDWKRPELLDGKVQFHAENLSIQGLEIPSADGSLLVKGGRAQVPRLDIRGTHGNHALIEEAAFPIDNFDPEHWLDTARAKLAIVVADSTPLLQAFGSPEAKSRQLVEHRIAIDAVLEGRILSVQELGLESAAGNVRLSNGRIELGPQNQIQIQAAGLGRMQDLASIGELFGRSDWSGSLEGNLRLEGTYPELGGALDLAGTKVQLEGIFLGELELEIKTAHPGADIEVSRLRLISPQGQVDGRLRITPGEDTLVQVLELVLERQNEQLAMQSPTVLRISTEQGSLEPLVLEGNGGRLECQGNWAGDDFEVSLDATRLNPNLLNTLQEGTPLAMAGADMRLNVLRRAGLLEFRSEGQVSGWVPSQWPKPIDMRWSLVHKEGHLRIRSFEALQGEQVLLGLNGACPIEFSQPVVFGEQPLAINLEAHLPLGLLQEGASGVLNLGGNFAGTWRALTGSIDVLGKDLRLAPGWHPEVLSSGQIQGQLRLADGLTLENASLQFGKWIDASIQLTSNLPQNIPHWIDSFDEALAASEVQSHLEVASLDVEKLRPLLNGLSESFEILREGKLTGDLHLSGPLSSPQMNGRLNLADGRVRPGGGLPPIEALGAELQLERERIVVREVRGTLGAAPFTIVGEVLFSEDSPTVNLKLEGEDLLLLRNPDARVRANTALRVHGDVRELKIQGKLELTTGNYSPQLDFLNMRSGPQSSSAQGFQLFTFREPPLRDMAFDIELTALDSFGIHNSILNGSIRPALHLGGTGLLPILKGTVFMEPTRLNLPVAQMDITGGTLRFLEDNPFVPQLDIQGKTRQLGYDIRADISGAYDDPELLLSSTPPLSQEDLFLLLVTGRLPEDPNRANLLSTANTVALYLARDALARWFSEDGPLNEDSVAERLDFAIGQDVSKNGSESFEVSVRITDRMGKPAATRNARHTYLVAERDKYEDYNYGLRWVFRFRR